MRAVHRQNACVASDLLIGNCRQNLPTVDLIYQLARASGDAAEIDPVDRDLSLV